MATSLSKRVIDAILKPVVLAWGRYTESYLSDRIPPTSNPDDTDPDHYYDISLIPYITAGRLARDISHLWVSARGLTPEDNNASSPPQLIYTTPDIGDQEVLESLAYQYDEGFDGGFAPIIRSLEAPAMQQGRCIAEIEWYRREEDPYKGFIFAKRIYSRDPEEYKYDYEGVPGIYLNSENPPKRMNDLSFMSYAYDPLYNNPYGQSINRPLKRMSETWIKCYGYWEHALEKAGMGSWVAKYGNRLMGKAKEAVDGRSNLMDALKKLASGTVSIFHKDNEIEQHKLQVEAQLFLDFHTAYVQAVSLLYTGSATALAEGKYGSYSKEEATSVREKAAREHMDALRVSMFWTYEFNRRFCRINFAPNRLKIYPTLQLISPELIFPTTPEGQDTESVPEDHQVQQRPEKQEGQPEQQSEDTADLMAELQEAGDAPPMTVPPTYHEFPSEDPIPESYRAVTDLATDYLSTTIVARSYTDTTPDLAPTTFTMKRLRNFSQDTEILEELKEAIVPTLFADTEAEAWEQYYIRALRIFAGYGIRMSSNLRDNMITSFRQARKNAFGAAVYEGAQRDPNVVAMRLITAGDDQVRHSHDLWEGVVLSKDDPLLKRLQTPMDFRCRCRWEPVSYQELSQYPITPQEDLPQVMPGKSYRLYAVQ